jgi:probable addiction module antidote protein
MKVKLSRFDAADYLTSPERIEAYLDEAAASGDPAFIASALGDVARAGNLSHLSRETGISLPGLRKALSGGGNPTLETIMKVAKALDITVQFVVTPQHRRTKALAVVPPRDAADHVDGRSARARKRA